MLSSAALLVSGLAVSPPAVAAPAAAPTPVTSAPDLASAQAAARDQKTQVRVESMMTATDEVWANPDGSLTVERGFATQRVRQSDGSWAEVDLNLVQAESGLSSAVPAVPVSYAGAGSSTVGSVSVAGGAAALEWEAPLPAPVLSGTTATYPDVRPGVDLQVEALRSGFEVNFLIKTAPTGPLSLPLSLSLPSGVDATPTLDGGVSVADSLGKELVRGASPLIYGSTRDPQTHQPRKIRPMVGTLGVKSGTAKGGSERTWTLTPDPAYFTDPDVTYPVVADPGLTVGWGADTYIKSTLATSAFDTATHVYIGTLMRA